MGEYILEMKGISKEFPGVKALDDVTFSVRRGEIHALVGENGAGKSTLMKILSGVYPAGAYSGSIAIDGAERRFRDTKESERSGVAIIYQELALVKQLSIIENICLGDEIARAGVINWDESYRRAERSLAQAGLKVNPAFPVSYLGVAAAGGDSEGALQEREDTRTRRADGGPLGRRERETAGHPEGPEAAGRHLHLHLPQAQGGLRDSRPDHRAARRQDGRDAR
jgi:ABC-type sugar transport system ATPase subunit